MTKVVILCGGLGTRLREQTEFVPKPLIPIGSKPILWHIMKIFCHQGFREFVLPLGYRGDMIKEYFVHYRWRNYDFSLDMRGRGSIRVHDGQKCDSWKIHFVDTGVPTNTARRVYLIRRLLEKDDRFMLTYGDGVADVDIKKLIELHESKGCMATITGFRPEHRFGIIESNNGQVLKFKEKPMMSDWVNCGFMVFNREALDYFDGEDIMLEEVLHRIAKDDQLAVYKHEGCWHYMDTQRDYEELNRIWGINPGWKVWTD
jgi:glucose-1-phosphate cytidylyltransferase